MNRDEKHALKQPGWDVTPESMDFPEIIPKLKTWKKSIGFLCANVQPKFASAHPTLPTQAPRSAQNV